MLMCMCLHALFVSPCLIVFMFVSMFFHALLLLVFFHALFCCMLLPSALILATPPPSEAMRSLAARLRIGLRASSHNSYGELTTISPPTKVQKNPGCLFVSKTMSCQRGEIHVVFEILCFCLKLWLVKLH